MAKIKPFKCVCEGTDYIEIIFAKSKRAAKKIFASLYKLGYINPDISIKRVKSLAHLKRENGYIMDWRNPADRLVLLKHGYGCGYEEDPMNICEYCFFCENCEPYQEFRNG